MQGLPDLWEEPADSEVEARERVLAIRKYINEEVGDFYAGEDYHVTLARLYIEWAWEHLHDLTDEYDRDDVEPQRLQLSGMILGSVDYK